MKLTAYRMPIQADCSATTVPPLKAQSAHLGRFPTFLLWAGLVSVVFFSIYPATNWLASLRGDTYALYFEAELHLPFIPGFVWFYFSMYLLFFLPPFFLSPVGLRRLGEELVVATGIAGLIFTLFPARLGFTRTLPNEPPYRQIFQSIFSLDRPFNLAPSLHVVYTTAIVLAIAAQVGKTSQTMLYLWLMLVAASTLLVHQHHLLDVASGALLAGYLHFYWRRKNHD